MGAGVLDESGFYSQRKAQSRTRDIFTGELLYRWTETGALDHHRYAHAFDHLYGAFRRSCGVSVDFV